nr:hypothetical protein [Tanacetum cinerariifolium]
NIYLVLLIHEVARPEPNILLQANLRVLHYGLHQAPRAWYETLANYLLENSFQRGKIDQTLFIKKQKGDILQVQVYVDDIIFGSTNKELCKAFEKLIKDKFQMSSMGELTFFRFTNVRSASTPIETDKPLLKDLDVKRIFRYLKGKPHLGLWYYKDSTFNLVAYSDSDYAGASLDRKSTKGGCQFLGCRLIYWQYKKKTVVATSSTEAEYVKSFYWQYKFPLPVKIVATIKRIEMALPEDCTAIEEKKKKLPVKDRWQAWRETLILGEFHSNHTSHSLFNSQKEMDHQYPTVAKIPVLDTRKFEQWQFRIQQYLQHEHYALWEVIEFGDSYKVPTNTDPDNATTRKDDEQSGRTVTITTEDMQRKKNDGKARTTLLLSLPDEHHLSFSKFKTAKELWAAILKTFGGNNATKKRKKNLLKKQYGNFKAEGPETLEQTFNRLQVIVSQLQFMDVEVEKDDLNQKFLTSLAPEWLMHTIVWRNKNDLDTMSLDDLYNHLKVYEAKVQKKSNSNSQDMAFISSLGNNNNENGNTACVTTASTAFPTGSVNVATISQDTASAYIASQSNGPQIKFKDINHIDEDDMEEIDIKWSMALLSIRADKFWKRTGKKISIQGSDVAGFDKSKVECFNYHKMVHFARECKAPRSQKRGRKESYRQGTKAKEKTLKALMAIDGVGWDWSYMANDGEDHALVADEEAPTEFAFMANTESKNLDHLIESRRSDQIKEGVGYNVVPPPAADLYLSPKKDLHGLVYQNLWMTLLLTIVGLRLLRRVQRETTRSQNHTYRSPSHRSGGHRPHGALMRPPLRSVGHRPHGTSMRPSNRPTSHIPHVKTGWKAFAINDSDRSAEVHNYENCYDNEIFNMFTQEEQYTELLEPIPEPHKVPQNDNNVISEDSSVEQSGGTVEQLPANIEETRTKDAANQEVKKDVSSLRYIVLHNWAHDALLESSSSKPHDESSSQLPGFQDPMFPARVYKVEKAMYGLHQAPRAWYGESLGKGRDWKRCRTSSL